MNIEISEDLIKEHIDKKVSQIVGRWLEDHENYINHAIEKEVYDQIDRKYFDIVLERVEKIADEKIIEAASARLSKDIAEAYCKAYY